MLLLFACTSPVDSDTAATVVGTGQYEVNWSTDPAPPQAGEEAEFTLSVLGPDGLPVDDLQQNHERMVHSIFVSADLSSFQHVHQEDFTAISADDLRSATYRFPITWPLSGDYLVAFDYAHENQFLQTTSMLAVEGAPAMASAPTEDDATTVTVDGITGTITWDVAPMVDFDSGFTVHLTDADGNPVENVTQWLGADAHAVFVSWDLVSITHSHAWVPGMENASPGHEMPHLYPGPDIPVHPIFTYPGRYKMWFQFALDSAPDDPISLPFQFEVAG